MKFFSRLLVIAAFALLAACGVEGEKGSAPAKLATATPAPPATDDYSFDLSVVPSPGKVSIVVTSEDAPCKGVESEVTLKDKEGSSSKFHPIIGGDPLEFGLVAGKYTFDATAECGGKKRGFHELQITVP